MSSPYLFLKEKHQIVLKNCLSCDHSFSSIVLSFIHFIPRQALELFLEFLRKYYSGFLSSRIPTNIDIKAIGAVGLFEPFDVSNFFNIPVNYFGYFLTRGIMPPFDKGCYTEKSLAEIVNKTTIGWKKRYMLKLNKVIVQDQGFEIVNWSKFAEKLIYIDDRSFFLFETVAYGRTLKILCQARVLNIDRCLQLMYQ